MLFALFVVLHFAILAVALLVNIRLAGGWLVWLETDRRLKERQAAIGFSDDSMRAMLIVLLAGILFYTMALSVTFDAADPRFRQPTDLLLWFLIAPEIEIWRQNARSNRSARHGVRKPTLSRRLLRCP